MSISKLKARRSAKVAGLNSPLNTYVKAGKKQNYNNMQKKYSEIITAFLKSHPLISVKGLEEALNIPQSTIGQMKTGRLIPEKHIFGLICHLANYGMEIDGYTLSYDPADGVLTGRKWAENIETIEENGAFTYIVKECRMLADSYFDLF